jgi:alpha,alpha-trehalose phosphorylase
VNIDNEEGAYRAVDYLCKLGHKDIAMLAGQFCDPNSGIPRIEGYNGSANTGIEGTYINGFYESDTIQYGEIAYGYAENSQTMLNVTNGKPIKLYIEDEEFDMLKGEVLEYRRELNFKEGVLKRDIVWRSPKGKEVKINIKRLVSFKSRHLIAINYKVTPLNFQGNIKLLSSVDGDVTNLTVEDDPRVGSGLKGRVLNVDKVMYQESCQRILQSTKRTKFSIACAAANELITESRYSIDSICEKFTVGAIYNVKGVLGQSIELNKYVTYVTSLDYSKEHILDKAYDFAVESKEAGFEEAEKQQKSFMDDFWHRSHVSIEGDEAVQQGIRFNMFHLLQSAGRDGKTNIGSKGLTGEGYEGHYFWDTETYMLPFFLFSNPQIARKLLEYRYSILDKARERAVQMAHTKGALFPWRTIGGEECSAYYPAGTAQYHIDADIAFAVKRYVEATEDYEFLINYGAEILFETARMWSELGEFIKTKGNKFCINGVTGPDEYTAIVNNNCYTNLMAGENLNYAYKTALWMKENVSEEFNNLIEKIALEEDEIIYWKKASANMYIPYNEELKIHLQDDAFIDKAQWDFENTPKENYPLLLHYHPLVIYRHQVCKQADVVLAMYLLSNKFSLEDKKRNYDYYEGITTHDSSLSTCIFSIQASEIGYHDKAYEYFMNTARMDLDDCKGNTQNGVHAANMAGTWLCLVNGFGGMRAYDNVLEFNPNIPETWEKYSFRINYRNRLIAVTVDQNGTQYELIEGEPLKISHYNKEILLKSDYVKSINNM